jgi:hypothetical protein
MVIQDTRYYKIFLIKTVGLRECLIIAFPLEKRDFRADLERLAELNIGTVI